MTCADPSLVGALDRLLRAHPPADDVEQRSITETLDRLASPPDPFDQHAHATHVTASAIVRDAKGRILLHRHKRLDRWLQPGGHIEPDEAPETAAVREAREETGVVGTHPSSGPLLVHVDAHPGPRGHRHLDLRYLLLADAAEVLIPAAGESPDVAWWPLERARAVADRSLDAAIRAVLGHV